MSDCRRRWTSRRTRKVWLWCRGPRWRGPRTPRSWWACLTRAPSQGTLPAQVSDVPTVRPLPPPPPPPKKKKNFLYLSFCAFIIISFQGPAQRIWRVGVEGGRTNFFIMLRGFVQWSYWNLVLLQHSRRLYGGLGGRGNLLEYSVSCQLYVLLAVVLHLADHYNIY